MTLRDNMPLVSIIMPAYNAEKYIERAVDSVLQQSYSNIELVICDDSSTDNTCQIIERYKDERIKFIKEKYNSGSAYIPRYKAYMHSNGEYVMYLDSDDFLSENYIEELVLRILFCQADVCCSCTVFVDEKGESFRKNTYIPNEKFDFSVQLNGKEAFLYTIPCWEISTAGLLAKREKWGEAFKSNYKNGRREIHDDENLFRYIFLSASKVVFSQNKYFYRMNSASVTHFFNKKTIGFMNSELDLLNKIRTDFGTESKEYHAAEASDYVAFCHVLGEMIKTSNSIKEEDLIDYLCILKKWHSRLNWQSVRLFFNRMKILIEQEYILCILVRLIKYDVNMSKRILIIKFAYSITRNKKNIYYKML